VACESVVEGFPTKLDSIQLGLWISRYGIISVKDTLCKIKYQKENTLNFGKPLLLDVGKIVLDQA
jgi:hypothetical protein